MNPKVLFMKGAVLCALVFIGLGTAVDGSGTRSTSRRRRCRCKKYIEQLNLDIDKRLKAFESRFEQYFTQSIDDLSNKTENSISADSDRKINSLTEDVNQSKQTLEKESFSLKMMQRSIQTQEVTVETLNNNFKTLESIVRNLSRVVENLENSMRNNIDLSKPPKKKHKKRKSKKPEPEPLTYPKDCDEVFKSGGMQFLGDYYIMVQPERSQTPFKTVCKIIDGSGWTVIQRRQDGRENFSRDWLDYKNGFGDLQDEFWLGNEKIHLITTQDDYELKIDMEDWEGKKYCAEYDRFRVSGEDDNYRLHVSGYHGTAGDSLTSQWKSHDGVPFSTRDNDNDNRFYDNCAENYNGGWWYNECFDCHLNGKYYQNGSHNNYFVRNGIQWKTIHSYSSLKFVEIMIKPSDAKLPNDI